MSKVYNLLIICTYRLRIRQFGLRDTNGNSTSIGQDIKLHCISFTYSGYINPYKYFAFFPDS